MTIVQGQQDSVSASVETSETCAQLPMVVLRALCTIIADATRRHDVDDLVASLFRNGHMLGIKSVALWAVEGAELHLVASAGHRGPRVEPFGYISLSNRVPCSVAVATSMPVVCRDRQQLTAEFPMVSAMIEQVEAVVSLPVVARGKAVGGLTLQFLRPIDTDENMMLFLTSVTDLVTMMDLADLATPTVRTLSVITSDRADAEVNESMDQSRLSALETEVTSLRQVLIFLADIINERFDGRR